MTYALLDWFTPGTGPEVGSDESLRESLAWIELAAQMRDAGVLVSERSFDLGPHAADAPACFAVQVLDVPDRESAEQWASRAPHLDYGWVEIRHLQD